MNIKFELTKQDYIDFNIFHLSYSDSIRKSLFIQRYIVSLIFLVVPFVFADFSTIPLWYWLIGFVAIYIGWVSFYPRYIKGVVSKRTSKMIDEGNNVGIIGHGSLTLNDNGIEGKGEHSESKTNWSAVENVAETKNHIFIYISGVSAYIVPVRGFNSVGEKNEFIDKINYFINKNKSEA
ncbi:YcxB family protein [Clostridium cylindrosporum]|uniref:YcxB-like C-terminal domain-containing protein n=1 Tax=Clostridium cylindrosporum DSM 605 TaxID=1121307 RepID=A0A0J8DC47_CLOCY|nr:YcxB family protein [Clostridium cylindrosporum]KMT21879.1 hypothetical protein CLCY_3c01500 [Clostridium cylindrosporum DSM 605]